MSRLLCWNLLILGLVLLVGSQGQSAQIREPSSKVVGRITGALVFRERVDFLPGMQVNVSLREKGRGTAPDITVSEQVIENPIMAPIPFVLEYNPANIRRHGRYVIHARIYTTRDPLYISTPEVPIFTAENPGQNVRVLMLPVRGRGETTR